MLFCSSFSKEYSLSFHLPILIFFLFMQHCCCWSSLYLNFFPSANVMSFIFFALWMLFSLQFIFLNNKAINLLFIIIYIRVEMTIEMLMNSPLRFFFLNTTQIFGDMQKNHEYAKIICYLFLFDFLLYFSLSTLHNYY